MPRFPAPLAAMAAIALAAGAAVAAEPARYAIDPVHTRVLVAISHAGFSKALGTVSGSSGTLHFGEGWAGARVDVEVPLDRLDFGDAKWNAAVQDLLGTRRHPRARFVSTLIEPVDATRARACGDLSLHGTTRPLCMDVRLNAVKRHPLPPFRRTAGFSATASLDRTAFGVDRWRSVIGETVELRIEVEATREAAAANDAEDGAR